MEWSILLTVCCFYNTLYAEYTIEGQVTDIDSGEPLIGASVVLEKPKIGATTDINGNFSITLPDGKHTLKFMYVGYSTKMVEVYPDYKGKLKVEMNTDGISTEEVLMVAGRTRIRKSSSSSAFLSKGVKGKTINSGIAKKEITKAATKTKWIKRKADKNALSANPDDAVVWCLVEVDGDGKEIKTLSKKKAVPTPIKSRRKEKNASLALRKRNQ